MPEMTELECRPRGASAKDWLADAPSAGLASLGSLHFTAAIHHSRLCACDFYANPSTHPPTQLPVCDAHLSVPPLTSGGPTAVGVARCWEGRRPRRALQRTASKIQRFALKFVREGRRRQKTRWVVQKIISKSRFVGQSERVAVSRTGSRK